MTLKKNSRTEKFGSQSQSSKSATSRKNQRETPKDFIETLERELTEVLKPMDMKLTKQEITSMGKDIMLLIPHLYMLQRLVCRTQEYVYLFFEKYGQERIVKAGNAANKVKRKATAANSGRTKVRSGR